MHKNKRTNDITEAPSQPPPEERVNLPEPEVVHEIRRGQARAVITRQTLFGWYYKVTLVTLTSNGEEVGPPRCIYQSELRAAVDTLIEARDWMARRLENEVASGSL